MIRFQRNLRGIPPLKLYLLFLGMAWLLFVAARLVFAALAFDSLATLTLDELFQAFYIGCRFDGRLAAVVTLPIGIILSVPPLGRRLQGWSGRILFFYFLAFFALWFVYAIDLGFYSYLGVRLNATLFELLEDFTVSLDMVWQSYPLLWILLGLIAAALLSALLFRHLAAKPVKPYWSMPGKICAWLLGFAVFAWAAYGQVSSNLFPLRWSNAYFSPNPAAASLALNPVQNLFDTYRNSRDDGFDPEAARAAYPLMAAYLGVEAPDAATLNYARHHVASAVGPGAGPEAGQAVDGPVGLPAVRPPNVVIIIMESLGYAKSSFAPGPEDPTPFIRELAAQSLYYPHFYANTRTTARAVFTTLTGIPDVTQSSTGSRNQLVVDQRPIADQFEGYDKFYMLGGNTNWANIRGILSNNIAGLAILEESAWKAPNADVWGISDWDLLHEAHERLAALKEKPFLAVIQTASFHKPYTIPDNIPGFEKLTLSEESRLNYGFVSEEEYNSMRLADYAVREFFRLARQSDYYQNTIFVIFGDHGINDPNRNMSASYNAAKLTGWHVPMLVHAPGRLEPGVDERPASQIDVFPTVASLAGLDYTNWTMGRDLLDPRFNGSRAAFISGKNDSPIRLQMDDFVYFDNRAGREALYRLSDPSAKDYRPEEPERFEKMRGLARAMQDTARYMLYNNKK